MRNIDAIVALLDEMESQGKDISIYRPQIPVLTSVVLNHPNHWGQVNSGRIPPLELLEALAGRFDDLVPHANTSQFEKVREFLGELSEALDDADMTSGVPEHLVKHMQNLIGHVTWCLDHYDEVGDFELQDAMDRLAVDLMRVTSTSNDPSRWQRFWTNWGTPFAVNMISGVPGQLMINAVLGQ